MPAEATLRQTMLKCGRVRGTDVVDVFQLNSSHAGSMLIHSIAIHALTNPSIHSLNLKHTSLQIVSLM